MNQENIELIDLATDMFVRSTGLNVTHQHEFIDQTKYPDGMVRIDQQKMQWVFTAQVRPRVARATVILESLDQMENGGDRIVIAKHITPQIADLMQEMGVFFMDTAGNVFINKPPLYVFIKGNKPPEKVKAPPIKRLFKPAGLKVIFAFLNNQDMVNWPYREIAAATEVALGTVNWIFEDLREMGALIEIGKRKRRIRDKMTLMKRWVEAYPDQLRPKLVIERFKADEPDWWRHVDITDYNACWGGEVAAAKLTQRLKPQSVVVYADEPPGKLIIEKRLRKATPGNVEILRPFWKLTHEFVPPGIAPPLLVYADLMATGDGRNIETARIIYDKYLAQLDRQD